MHKDHVAWMQLWLGVLFFAAALMAPLIMWEFGVQGMMGDLNKNLHESLVMMEENHNATWQDSPDTWMTLSMANMQLSTMVWGFTTMFFLGCLILAAIGLQMFFQGLHNLRVSDE